MKAIIVVFLFLTSCALNNEVNHLKPLCKKMSDYHSFLLRQDNWKIKGYALLNQQEKIKFIWSHNSKDNKIIIINDYSLLLAKIGWSRFGCWLKVNKEYYKSKSIKTMLLDNFNIDIEVDDPIKLLLFPKKISNLSDVTTKCFDKYLLVNQFSLKMKQGVLQVYITNVEFS
jgi:hypothetical protein